MNKPIGCFKAIVIVLGSLLILYFLNSSNPKHQVDKDDCINSLNSQKEEAIDTLYQ